MPDFLSVEEILSNLSLKEGMMAAEFGCGGAAFTIALAKKLSKGRVYALDIQEEKLSALKGKLGIEKINNVVMILCDLEAPKGSTIRDNFLDIVLIPNVLFQSNNRRAIIEESERVLKSNGNLLVIDWLKKAPFSPEESMMVKPDEIKKIAGDLKLSLTKEFAVGDYYYGLLFSKE